MSESLSATCLHLDNHDHSFLKPINVLLKDLVENARCLAHPRQGVVRPAREGHPDHSEFYLPTAPILQRAPGAR